MDRCLAFVLGGGGARGAMQVGALRALFEAGFRPDLLVGTSIGAANATGLAMWGVNLTGIEALEKTYQEMAVSNLMDPRLARLTLRVLSGRPNHHASRRVSEFFIERGITPELCFDQIKTVRLAVVGADLTSGQPVIYGRDPGESVLEGLLASIALPPWFAPVETDGQYIVDGGVVSNLPIEPALEMGATEIIALDLDDPSALSQDSQPFGSYLGKLMFALSRRHVQLETAIAEVQGVPVHRIELQSLPATPIWDFHDCKRLIGIGYEMTRHKLSGWVRPSPAEFTVPNAVAECQPA